MTDSTPLFLGINAAYHEDAAALMRGNEVVMAIEEERLTRVKHAKRATVATPDQLPWQAIDACLAAADAKLADVTEVGYAFMPGPRLGMIDIDPYPLADPKGWGSAAGEREFDRRLRTVPALLAERAGRADFADRVRFLPHHLAHAASAYHAGPFADAAVLVIDGVGEMATAWLGHGRDGALEQIEEVPYPHSIGMMWERLSVYIGLSEYDAGKAMGLAAFGDPDRFADKLSRIFAVPDPQGGTPLSPTPPFIIDAEMARFRGDLSGFESLFGPAWRPGEELPGSRFADLAAAVQRRTEEAVLATARRLRAATGSDNLAYAGGVALNCVANGKLESDGPFSTIYVTGPAHDAGTALGAALELARKHGYALDLTPGDSLYPLLGPSYDDDQVAAAIAATDFVGERVDDPALLAAEMIVDGKVVGWFQGPLELGPRALGNRSLLADPRRAESRQRLNDKVKKRESFRPFAASCLEEALPDWFEFPADKVGGEESRELMLLAYPVHAARRDDIAGLVHLDGTCRIQTVDAVGQPLYHRLISHFAKLTGVPMVLNTSFNRREPIVCSPEHALATFARTGIDAVFLGNHLVRKTD